MPQESSSSHESRTLFEGFVTLTEESVPTAAGPYPYVTVHTRPFSVIVLPQRSDGKWLVTKEWRHPVKRFVYSFPGGLVDDNETPLEASHRELLEETGFAATRYTPLGTCLPLPGLLDQTMSVVLAHDVLYRQEPKTDDIEVISYQFFSMEDLQELFRTSHDTDAMALAALALLWIKS